MDRFTPKPYGVYVLIDTQGRITSINSDAFIVDLAGWIRIDEGYGDRLHHAQGNYLSGPLYDDRGICRYKLVDGAAVERTQAEQDADYAPPTPVVPIEQRVEVVETKTTNIEDALGALMEGIANA